MNINELKLSEQGRNKFLAEVKKQMMLRNWGVKELAMEIGYSRESLYTFFSNSKIKNKKIAGKICSLFELNPTEYTN